MARNKLRRHAVLLCAAYATACLGEATEYDCLVAQDALKKSVLAVWYPVVPVDN